MYRPLRISMRKSSGYVKSGRWSTLFRMNRRRAFLLQSLSFSLAATGCTSFSKRLGTATAPNSVAVLGVVQRSGLNLDLNEYRLAADFEDILRDNHGYSVMAIEQARQYIGAERHDLLLRRVANSGSLDRTDLRMLNQANMPTRMGVFLTITGNEEAKLDPEQLQLRDDAGRFLQDRQHVVLATSRRVSLTATLVNLGLERVRMHNEFRFESIERKRFLEYSGTGFTGSLAARLANTVANGVIPPDWPKPPELYDSYYQILIDVGKRLPIG